MIPIDIFLTLFAIALGAASLSLFQRKRLDQARRTASESRNQTVSLRKQLNQARESAASEKSRRADAEARMRDAEDSSERASEETARLADQLEIAKRDSQRDARHNAELVAELKQTRREIRRLSKALADRNSELDQARGDTTAVAESNDALKTQLALARQAAHEERSLRLVNQTVQHQAQRDSTNQRSKREEIEKQLIGARRDVTRLTKEIRALQAALERERRSKGEDDQTISDLKSHLSRFENALMQEKSRRRQIQTALDGVQAQLELENHLRLTADSRVADAERETEALREAQAEIAAQSEKTERALEDLRHAHANLTLELQHSRDESKPDPELVRRLERELKDLEGENRAQSNRIAELESQLDEANRKANLAVYEHRIESCINAVNRDQCRIMSAMRIGNPEIKRDRKRSVSSIRHAQQIAGMIETMIDEAVAAGRELQTTASDESNYSAEVEDRIDAGIKHTDLTVDKIITFGHSIEHWNH